MKRIFSDKIMYRGVIGVVIFTLLVVGLNTYQLYWPVKVFEIKSIQMVTPQVKPGEDAVYHVNYCRYFEGDIHVFKSIDGPSLIYIPMSVNSNPPGCREADVHVSIPASTIPGTYTIKIVAEAQVNPNKKATVRFQTDAFEVIK